MYATANPGPADPSRRAPVVLLPLVLAVIAAAAPLPSRAQPATVTAQTACKDERVQVEGALSDQWLDAVIRLCDALAKMNDVDPSARLHIAQSDADLVVGAVVADGRVAVRRVQAPEELLPTVEALVVLPAQSAETATAPAVPAAPPASPPPLVAPAPERIAAPAPSAPAAQRLRIEVGAEAVGRIARAPTYLSAGFELYAGLRTGAWLLALSVRFDPVVELVHPVHGFEVDTGGAGFVIARRVIEGPIALDAGLDTWLLAERQDYLIEGGHEASDTDVDVRLGGLGRVLFGAPKLRWALSLQAEVSPLRLRRDLQVAEGLPKLPSWAIGLGFGAAWEEL